MIREENEITRCHRCKDLIEGYTTPKYAIIRDSRFGEEEIELCDRCYREFLDFLEVDDSAAKKNENVTKE